MPRVYPKGWQPTKVTKAVYRHQKHRRLAKKVGFPPEWRASNKPLRQLWNEYYMNTSETLFRRCLACQRWDELVPSYKVAKGFIDKVAHERPTKLGVRADLWRDLMRQHLEKQRRKEIQRLKKNAVEPHHSTTFLKL